MLDDEPRLCCTLVLLDPGDPGHALGYRAYVEQFDGDRHFFGPVRYPGQVTAEARAREFIARHGMTLIADDAMEAMRTRVYGETDADGDGGEEL